MVPLLGRVWLNENDVAIPAQWHARPVVGAQRAQRGRNQARICAHVALKAATLRQVCGAQ